MYPKNAILFQRNLDLATAMSFGLSPSSLLHQLTIVLVSIFLLLSYSPPVTHTQAFASTAEQPLRQGIPQSRISGASR